MKTSRLFPALAVTGAVASFAGNAVADITLLDANTSTWDSLIGQASHTVNGVLFDATGGTFNKGGINGYTGFGVNGGTTPNEIDIGETITLSWGSPDPIASFAVALLFDGPEWGDVAEVVQVTAFGAATHTGYLTVTGDNSASWDFNGQTISAISPAAQATETGAGAWRVINPFGSFKYDKLVFGAVTGACTNPPAGGCYSQSDYALMEVTVVPEPQVFALMLAGLGAIGFVARRRRLRN